MSFRSPWSALPGVAFVVALFSTSVAWAAPTSTSATSDNERLTSIAQNCTSIKQSLTQLQRADSRTRTYLGSFYETVANNFITPLNLRLVKNNRPNTTLVDIQTAFTTAQADFRNAYTTYMRDLESLLATDCQTDPALFSDRLDTARAGRATLSKAATRLNALVKEQIKAVQKFQEGL